MRGRVHKFLIQNTAKYKAQCNDFRSQIRSRDCNVKSNSCLQVIHRSPNEMNTEMYDVF